MVELVRLQILQIKANQHATQVLVVQLRFALTPEEKYTAWVMQRVARMRISWLKYG